jgi:hypothetical protein
VQAVISQEEWEAYLKDLKLKAVVGVTVNLERLKIIDGMIEVIRKNPDKRNWTNEELVNALPKP